MPQKPQGFAAGPALASSRPNLPTQPPPPAAIARRVLEPASPQPPAVAAAHFFLQLVIGFGSVSPGIAFHTGESS